MSRFDEWKANRGRTPKLTPKQLVAAKDILNFLVADSFQGVSIGKLNVATPYYYGEPSEEDFDTVIKQFESCFKRFSNGHQ